MKLQSTYTHTVVMYKPEITLTMVKVDRYKVVLFVMFL